MPRSTHDSYKERKENFVSNLSGSSLIDIHLVTFVAASAVLLWTALQKRKSLFTPYSPDAIVIDVLLNIGGVLFVFTVYASAPILLNLLFILPGIVLLLPLQNDNSKSDTTSKKSKSGRSASDTKQNGVRKQTATPSLSLPVRPFLTHYRGTMLIATCLAILAVDFPIFPRRFAKVETWGTSLMDLGVGSFVFSAGVVSARGLIKYQQPGHVQLHFLTRFAIAFRHSLPLIILGLVRLYSVKGMDLPEHVTEYGVHWNFFFTLALLPPFVELSDSITRHLLKSYDVMAVILAIIYEIVLDNTDLLEFILSSKRGPDLLSKNREGLFSFVSYLAIFLAGRGTGLKIAGPGEALRKLSSKYADPVVQTWKERIGIFRTLLKRSVVYWLIYIFVTAYQGLNLSVSRRLANLPYVLWVVAFNNVQIFLFGLIEHVGPRFSYIPEDAELRRSATSTLVNAFNRNGLALFLVANILTGLVNVTVRTLDITNFAAMAILLLYAAVLTAVALGLDRANLSIKI